jgi:molybdate transport system substrate-binding protein
VIKLALVVLAALVVCGCTGNEGRPRLVVSAASSLTPALTSCSSEFSAADVRLQFAGSDELAAQMRRGVKPDVFAAANTKLPNELYAEGLLDKPVVFAGNELVLAVPAGSKRPSLQRLAKPGVKLAIGSKSVPVGVYTRELLSQLPTRMRRGILANVGSEEPEVKGIVGKLTQKAVDAGFVYETDVIATKGKLTATYFPPGASFVKYGAGLVRGTDHGQAARKYLDGLVSGTCAKALRRAGFKTPSR